MPDLSRCHPFGSVYSCFSLCFRSLDFPLLPLRRCPILLHYSLVCITVPWHDPSVIYPGSLAPTDAPTRQPRRKSLPPARSRQLSGLDSSVLFGLQCSYPNLRRKLAFIPILSIFKFSTEATDKIATLLELSNHQSAQIFRKSSLLKVLFFCSFLI